MNDLQKMGGIAALYAGAAYVVGMVFFLSIVDVASVVDPIEKIALMGDNLNSLYFMHIIIYVVWGVFMVLLSLALFERLKASSPAIVQMATVFGVMWACVIIVAGLIYNSGMVTVVEISAKDAAQAATVWLAVDSVYAGMGGSSEVLGGLWILLISWAALRSGDLPRVLNYLGALVGVAGIVSVVPALAEIFIFIFALGQIVWFIWLGTIMLSGRTSTVAQ